MKVKHTCPLRYEDNNVSAAERTLTATVSKNRDTYGKGHGLIGQPSGCSYCGSMSPDDFMTAMREGKVLDVTDKDYKAYVQGIGTHGGKFYYQHLSAAQRTEFIRLLNENKIQIGWPGHFTVLPYFTKVAP